MIPGAAVFLVLVAIVVPAFFVLMWIVGGYNRLVGLRKGYQQAFGQTTVQLKGRYDLILKLVEHAKGYTNQDPGAVEAVIAARNVASTASIRAARSPGDSAAMKELSGAESALARTLGRLFAILEQLPDLKRNNGMLTLMEELTSFEDKVALPRRAYNDAVMSYNTLRETFPNNVIAVLFSFGPAGSLLIESSRVAQPV